MSYRCEHLIRPHTAHTVICETAALTVQQWCSDEVTRLQEMKFKISVCHLIRRQQLAAKCFFCKCKVAALIFHIRLYVSDDLPLN